jgi:hypothetical protein
MLMLNLMSSVSTPCHRTPSNTTCISDEIDLQLLQVQTTCFKFFSD